MLPLGQRMNHLTHVPDPYVIVLRVGVLEKLETLVDHEMRHSLQGK